MATKKKGLARAHSRAKSAKRILKNAAAPTANPPLFTDMVEFIIPGFAGYAGTRFVSRIARGMVERRFPKLSKHAGPLASLAAFGASWFLVHRVQKVAKYHTPVTVGAAIAALQTIVQTYIPKYGWIVSDYQPQLPPSAGKTTQQTAEPSAQGALPLVENFSMNPSIDEQMASVEAELQMMDHQSRAVSPTTQPFSQGGAMGTLSTGSFGSLGDSADGLGDDDIGDILDELGDDYGGLAGGLN